MEIGLPQRDGIIITMWLCFGGQCMKTHPVDSERCKRISSGLFVTLMKVESRDILDDDMA